MWMCSCYESLSLASYMIDSTYLCMYKLNEKIAAKGSLEGSKILVKMETTYVIGVDVGSRSVRGSLVRCNDGVLINKCECPLEVRSYSKGRYEQSSTQIWAAVVTVVRECVANQDVGKVVGVGFDATCSLVVVDKNGLPISVSVDNDPKWNVIMWMDHRAEEEAAIINATKHSALKHFGGQISLEMEPPKMLWLKRSYPERFKLIGHAFDLPDFLTWKATNSLSRSQCSSVCKWALKNSGKWDASFWDAIGLSEVKDNNYEMIGSIILNPGQPCTLGLTEAAANELGLMSSVLVSTSIIDAHAGGVGLLGMSLPKTIPEAFSSRLCVIAGTSTCHMLVNSAEIFTPGVWGPYLSAMVPDMFLSEGGQSAAGELLDFICATHEAKDELALRKRTMGVKYDSQVIMRVLEEIKCRDGVEEVDELTAELHVWPDFHGNRSPLADPNMKGAIVGLMMRRGIEQLAILYLAAVQSLAYGTRHIVETLERQGHSISTILMCGGLSNNELYSRVHAYACARCLVLPEKQDAVILGSAILAAAASGQYGSVGEAMKRMTGCARRIIEPTGKLIQFHDKKYKILGIAVIVVGSLVLYGFGSAELEQDFEQYVNYPAGAILVVIVGVCIVVFIFCGCCGACLGINWLLIVFVVMMSAIVICEFAVMGLVWKHADRDKLEVSLTRSFQNAITAAKEDPSNSLLSILDFLQEKLECCGGAGESDYRKAGISPPRSCFKIGGYQISRGCGKATTEYLVESSAEIGFIVLALIICQIIAIILALVLYCQS